MNFSQKSGWKGITPNCYNHESSIVVYYMDKLQIAGLIVIIAGVILGIVDSLSAVYSWSAVPPNVFIIGLGLIVIGLVMAWVPVSDAGP